MLSDRVVQLSLGDGSLLCAFFVKIYIYTHIWTLARVLKSVLKSEVFLHFSDWLVLDCAHEPLYTIVHLLLRLFLLWCGELVCSPPFAGSEEFWSGQKPRVAVKRGRSFHFRSAWKWEGSTTFKRAVDWAEQTPAMKPCHVWLMTPGTRPEPHPNRLTGSLFILGGSKPRRSPLVG